jgi:predicted dehydrogenase
LQDTTGPRRIRAGIIGPQIIGTVHCQALRAIGVEVAGVAASSAERAREHAVRLGVATAFATASDLIHADEIDTVHICTPNHLHAPLCQEALQAGKHVICEKPLATTLMDAHDVLRLANQTNLVHAVCYCYRYYTMPQLLRQWALSGRLGRVHLMQGSFLLDEILLQTNDQHWMLDPSRIGPSLSLADIGVHWWDLVEFVSGQRAVEVVCANNVMRGPNPRSDDSDALLMRLDGGAIATAAIGQAAPGHTNTLALELIGTKGSAAWNQERADALWYGPLGEPTQIVERTRLTAEQARCLPSVEARGPAQDQDDAFRTMMAAIYAPILGQEVGDSFPTFADGVRGMEILTAALRSVAEHRWVNVDDIAQAG